MVLNLALNPICRSPNARCLLVGFAIGFKEKEVLEVVQRRVDKMPEGMTMRSSRSE